MKQVNTPKQNYRIAANDNGYADHKVAWLTDKGEIMTGKVSAMIQVGGQGITDATGTRIGAYTCDGVEYSCGNNVSSPMSLRNADYPVSDANRVLNIHALTRHGLIGAPIMLAVTLPFRDFFNQNGTLNSELQQRTIQNFTTNNVTIVEGKAQPNIVGVKVYSEALSAWFDWAINDKNQMTPEYEELAQMQGEMLVVDIGGSTTDIASLGIQEDESLVIDHNRSGTQRSGVLDARSRLAELVQKKLKESNIGGYGGHGDTISPAMIGRILITGKGFFASTEHVFEQEREQACRAVATGIVNFIKSKVGNPTNYYAIFVVGGGAIVFRKWIEEALPNALFGDEFSNAKGALKYMRMMTQEGA